MFTGIVEKVRVVRRRAGERLLLDLGDLARTLKIGASLSVDGVCLTVVEKNGAHVAFDLSDETRRRTTLGRLRPGQWVNIERPVRFGDPLGGHLVQGHVDGIGCVLEITAHERGASARVAVTREIRRWLVPRGAIAVSGVSLTIASLGRTSRRDATLLRYYQKVLRESEDSVPDLALMTMLDWIGLNLVPHTLRASTLGDLREGDLVNLEADVMLKWLAELRKTGSQRDPFAGAR